MLCERLKIKEVAGNFVDFGGCGSTSIRQRGTHFAIPVDQRFSSLFTAARGFIGGGSPNALSLNSFSGTSTNRYVSYT